MGFGGIIGQTPIYDAKEIQYSNGTTSDIISGNNVQSAIDQLTGYSRNLFQSVSNGKQQVANAITGKGVPTSGTDTFATMAANIGRIPVGIDSLNIISSGAGKGETYASSSIPCNTLTIFPENAKEYGQISVNGKYTMSKYIGPTVEYSGQVFNKYSVSYTTQYGMAGYRRDSISGSNSVFCGAICFT